MKKHIDKDTHCVYSIKHDSRRIKKSPEALRAHSKENGRGIEYPIPYLSGLGKKNAQGSGHV